VGNDGENTIPYDRKIENSFCKALLLFYRLPYCVNGMTVMHQYYAFFLNRECVDEERGVGIGALVRVGIGGMMGGKSVETHRWN
jgi:hypothetical protein